MVKHVYFPDRTTVWENAMKIYRFLIELLTGKLLWNYMMRQGSPRGSLPHSMFFLLASISNTLQTVYQKPTQFANPCFLFIAS